MPGKTSIFFLAVFACFTLGHVSARLNLYMNETEAKRVLGFKGKFFFVHDGEVKKNAVFYRMRVPSSVDCLGFTWFREDTPTTYSILIESLTPRLVYPPELNIQSTGQVPQNAQTFCLQFKCRQEKVGEAQIQMNVTLFAGSTLRVLSFLRIKSCRREVVADKFSEANPTAQAKPNTDGKTSFSASEKTKVFYIAVGVACSVILVIALAVAAIHVHSMPSPSQNKDRASISDGSELGHGGSPNKMASAKRPLLNGSVKNKGQSSRPGDAVQKMLNQLGTAITPPKEAPQTIDIPVTVEINQPNAQQARPQLNQPQSRNIYMTAPPIPNTNLSNGDISRTMSMSSNVTALNRGTSVSSAPVPRGDSVSSAPGMELYPHAGGLLSTQKGKYGNRDIKSELADLEVDMSRITLGDLLYEGTFARIYEGVLTGPEEHQQQGVIVKTVSEIASRDQVTLMLIESSMLRDLTHKNLLPIMCVCSEDEQQPLVMFPFMNRGNLKLFLKRSRSPEGVSKSLTTADLVHMGIQVAKGMQYLARRAIVHKDLAARNCVLDDELNVKVTDCALSRDLFPGDYCCLCDNENRPVKWMAVESLESNRYTVSSDVWSYGVLLWELMTLALQPYANIDAFEMLNFLKKGHRIAQPVNCPDELFTVIACCWALSEDDRPSFGQLIVCLTEFHNALSNFI
ncbi:tyrosine-protein kinase RYK [Nematostella vectensis]|uniref:tyrosine-protein kinase RYK n=1 Tax=Nematostella vectensis TaxID=45351 RepID=UPI002076EEE4|nr:tyrosine-protein kinase RYK [Nematostella vectensis]